MEHHPRLTRPIHPLVRPDGSVQLGLDPRDALVATGVSVQECRWLATLDGSRSETVVLRDAGRHGIAPARASALVEAFAAEGVVSRAGAPAQVERRVAVVGAGTVPAHLTEVLREAGVRHVERRLVDTGPEPAPAEGDAAGTALAVLTSTVPVPAGAGEPWRTAGVPHLPVWCGPDHASVGPLLVPGSGPCLQCLELTRISLDPGWPWLRAQISRPRVGPVTPVETHAPTRSLLVGIAASLVLDALTRGPVATGWSLDASAAGPTLERRRWHRQPHCPRCGDPGTLSADDQVEPQEWAG